MAKYLYRGVQSSTKIVEKKMPNYFSASHACKHREKYTILLDERNLASEQEGALVPSFSEFGTTLIVYGTSSKSQILYLEPLLATHCGCPYGLCPVGGFVDR
jgi:hypothetical protein